MFALVQPIESALLECEDYQDRARAIVLTSDTTCGMVVIDETVSGPAAVAWPYVIIQCRVAGHSRKEVF